MMVPYHFIGDNGSCANRRAVFPHVRLSALLGVERFQQAERNPLASVQNDSVVSLETKAELLEAVQSKCIFTTMIQIACFVAGHQLHNTIP